jgi:hypothetical protein
MSITPSKRDIDPLLVAGLGAGLRVTDLVRLAGASKATIYRRLRDPALRSRIAEAREQLTSSLLETLERVLTQFVIER